MSAYLTPPQYAERLGVDVAKVHIWIRRGELRAINVAETLNGRPRWRIPPDAVVEFEERRTARPPAAKPRRRRRPKMPKGFVQYF